MPEGPEVKIMMENYNTYLKGRELVSIEVCKESFHKKTKGFEKLSDILPTKVIKCEAKGKCGYINLDNNYTIVIGFGMTGGVRVHLPDNILQSRGDTREKYSKHFSVRFVYKNDTGGKEEIFYNSVRNFGHVWVLTNAEANKKLAAIGPSILDPEVADETLVVKCLRRRNSKTICEALMDQSLLSGIGNYIKSEILYCVGIHPHTLVENVTDKQLYSLYMEARTLAGAAYKAGGTSLYTYTGIGGDKSDFKSKLQVYGKSRDPQGRVVETIKTSDGRTTHIVPDIQYMSTTPDKPKPKFKITIKPIKKT